MGLFIININTMKQTPFQQDNLIIILISIYCFVDDFHSLILTRLQPALKQPTQKHPPAKTYNLTVTELVTLALFFQFTGHQSWKDFYKYIKTHYRQDFPELPDYGNFVTSMNALSPYAVILLNAFCSFFRQQTPALAAKFADSTKLEVCNIKREFSHQVMKEFASKSKSTMGWFYGFKLHIICNELMQILDCRITTAIVDDRRGLMLIWNYIFGLIVADAGYLGGDFQVQARVAGKDLLTGVRANMKKLMTKTQHELLKLRSVVESVFSVLKLRMGMQSTLPRSPLGYFARYMWCLAAYQLKQYFMAVPLTPVGLLA